MCICYFLQQKTIWFFFIKTINIIFYHALSSGYEKLYNAHRVGNSKNALGGLNHFHIYYEKMCLVEKQIVFLKQWSPHFFSLKDRISQRQIKWYQGKLDCLHMNARIINILVGACTIQLQDNFILNAQLGHSCSRKRSFAYTCKYTEWNKYGNKYSKRGASRWKYGTHYLGKLISSHQLSPSDLHAARAVMTVQKRNLFMNRCGCCPTTDLTTRNFLASCFFNS